MKSLLTAAIGLLMSIHGFGQTTWVIDPAHSTIQFEVSHLTVSSVTGSFTSFNGSVISDNESFKGAKIHVTISTASVNTNNLERDKHLREEDFFDVSKYPEITFDSKSMEMQNDGEFILTGDLTIKGITHPIKLNGKFGGIISMSKKKKAGFSAQGTVDRFDYGLKWNDSMDNGGLIVGEKVSISINVELVEQ